MLDHDLADFGQFMTPGASVVRQLDRVEPELRITTGVSHMDVRRLPALQTVEEESITSNLQSAGTRRVYRASSRRCQSQPG